MLSGLLLRTSRPAGRLAACGRVEVCPPSLQPGNTLASSGWRSGLRDWLSTGWSASVSAAQGHSAGHAGRSRAAESHLCAVRGEFLSTLDDVGSRDVVLLRHRIGIAHSLRDLWHLRAQVFELVALGFNQAEAQQRLARLNRHFPTRSPRSGFAPLEPVEETPSRRT